MVKKIIFSILVLLGIWVLCIAYVSVEPHVREWWVNRVPSERTCYNNRALKVTFCKPENWALSASFAGSDGTSPERADVIDMSPPEGPRADPLVYIEDFDWGGSVRNWREAFHEKRGYFSDYLEFKSTASILFAKDFEPKFLESKDKKFKIILLNCGLSLFDIRIKSRIDPYSPGYFDSPKGQKVKDILQSLRCYEPKESDG